MKKKFVILSASSFGLAVAGFVAPLLVSAQSAGCPNYTGDINYLICRIGEIVNTIIPLLIVLGVVFFIWGVITYVIAKDEEAKKRGRSLMIYGIIGLVVIVSIWGLVSILKNTFGLQNSSSGTIQVPCIPVPPATSC